MKTPPEVLGEVIFYVIVGLVAVGVVWWFKDSVVGAIRAPVLQELNKATGANQSLKEDNERLVIQNTKLSDALAARSVREEKIDTVLDLVRQDFGKRKATNPDVKKWAETPIPPAVLQ